MLSVPSRPTKGEFDAARREGDAVAPGTTATERVLKARTPEDTRRVAEAIPVKRLGEPGEIAEAVVFLASDAAAFINGATLDVNGGQVMV
jgi:NAD(P)-dependent dehydrogenase (short-subunit alcohol dehydrogenase family)